MTTIKTNVQRNIATQISQHLSVAGYGDSFGIIVEAGGDWTRCTLPRSDAVKLRDALDRWITTLDRPLVNEEP